MTKPAPLEGLRVLDISEGLAGPFCAKLLADWGADVCKVERPGVGDAARQLGPFPGDTPDPEASAAFIFVNTSKRGITLDLSSEEGLARFRQLLAHYDVVIAGETAGELEARGLGYAQLRAWNPAVILTTLSGYGSDGPYAGYKWSHLTAGAMSGWSNNCGLPDREPLQAGGSLAELFAGSFAGTATLLAVIGRQAHGEGEHVDVSAQQATLTGALTPTLHYQYYDVIQERHSDRHTGPSFILPAADGYIGVNVLTQAQWELLCQFLGRPDMLEDPRFQATTRLAHMDEVAREFAPSVADRYPDEMFHEAQVWRVPFGLVPSLPEIPALPPHRDRGFFTKIQVGGREVEIPGVPFHSSVTESRVLPPPRLGEHNDQVFAELASAKPANPEAGAASQTAARDVAKNDSNPLPLAGLRIIDLSMFMSGPMLTGICADAGADVIKVESVQRIDGWRGGGRGEDQAWERSPVFNWINRNKRGITLNLTDSAGADLLKRLVADADVVIENYTPRVMGNFGLSYEVLRAIKPDLIMMSMPGFGGTGAWNDYVAFGLSTEQMAGISHLTGYADGQPMFTGTNGGDHLVGVMAAGAILSALHHRDRTGEGQYIDLGQVAVSSMYIGDALTGWALTGHDPGRVGNKHRAMSPHGIYACRDAGWIAIACRDAEEWTALATLIGKPEWAETGSPYLEFGARSRDSDLIDAAITAWTEPQSHIELMHRLQAARITAGAVLNGPQILADPQLAFRGGFVPQDRPGLGVKHYPNQPYHFARAELIKQPSRSPLLGEHSREVLSSLLGLCDEELDQLERDDVIGTLPIAARPD